MGYSVSRNQNKRKCLINEYISEKVVFAIFIHVLKKYVRILIASSGFFRFGFYLHIFSEIGRALAAIVACAGEASAASHSVATKHALPGMALMKSVSKRACGEDMHTANYLAMFLCLQTEPHN